MTHSPTISDDPQSTLLARFKRGCCRATLLALSVAALSSSNVLASTSVSLTQNERQVADNLTNGRAWNQTRSTATIGQHALGIQTLSIELDERKKGSQIRRARVYQFNYDSQQSRLLLIDLEKQTIVNQKNIDTIHLPLNSTEIQTAKALVENSEGLMAKLNERRAIRGKLPLIDLSTIDIKASIFEPDSPSHTCSVQRCALLSLFDQTRTVFTVEPLVNLQTLSVTTLQNSL